MQEQLPCIRECKSAKSSSMSSKITGNYQATVQPPDWKQLVIPTGGSNWYVAHVISCSKKFDCLKVEGEKYRRGFFHHYSTVKKHSMVS